MEFALTSGARLIWTWTEEVQTKIETSVQKSTRSDVRFWPTHKTSKEKPHGRILHHLEKLRKK